MLITDTPPAIPPLGVKLPIVGEYPADGTDAAKDQWLRLADLHQREAQRASSWEAVQASANATAGLAAANNAIAAAAVAHSQVTPAVVEDVLAQWQTHDAALEKLAAAIGGVKLPAPQEGGIAVSAFLDVLTGLLKALGPK